MKKIGLFIVMLVATLFASATPTDIETSNNIPYFKNAKALPGETIDITLSVKADNIIGTVIGYLVFPDGVTIKSVKGVGATNWVPTNYDKIVLGGCEGYNDVCTITVEISEDMKPGDYEMSFDRYQIVENNGLVDFKGESIVSTLTVSRTATIDELPAGYAVEVIPFVAKEGENAINIMYQAPEITKDLEFDITLPQGMFFYNSDYDTTTPAIVDAAQAIKDTTVPTVTITTESETTAHVKVAGNKLKKTGLVAATAAIPAFTMTTYVFAPGEYEEDYDYTQNSIQNIKISNIKLSNVAGTVTYSGKESLASVFFGVPTETDPVVYGHYTAEGTAALNSVAENFRTVEMSAATIDKGCVVNDVLVYTKEASSYNRAVADGRLATICVPFALEGDYYVVSSITSSSITLKEVSEVAANTPAITKGAIAVSGEANVALGTPSVGENNLTGTYEYLPNVEGYYLANNKFYNDGAEIKPFRAYIPGTGAKCLSVYLETANGVIDITNELSNEDIYSLQGIKMNNTRKGINIVGGKKIYVK